MFYTSPRISRRSCHTRVQNEGGSGTNLLQIAERIPDEAAAYEYLEQLRWNGTPECPHCGNDDRCYFLTPANGKTRQTRTGAATQRRLWKCGACRKQFSVLTGTVMHGTKIPVRTWVFVLYEMCLSKNGVAAREIERKYWIAPRSAWFMTQRIREAMASQERGGTSGPVVPKIRLLGNDSRGNSVWSCVASSVSPFDAEVAGPADFGGCALGRSVDGGAAAELGAEPLDLGCTLDDVEFFVDAVDSVGGFGVLGEPFAALVGGLLEPATQTLKFCSTFI